MSEQETYLQETYGSRQMKNVDIGGKTYDTSLGGKKKRVPITQPQAIK